MIQFNMPESGHVNIDVYNVRGQLIRSLVSDYIEKGVHNIEWNGTDDFGRTVSSGIYFYVMKTNEYQAARSMLLMK